MIKLSSMEDQDDMEQPPLFGETPWLLYMHRSCNYEKMQTFYPVSPSIRNTNSISYTKSIPDLRGKSMLTSSYGWLILLDRELVNIISIVNPVTLETINLPPLLDASKCELCALTSPPNSDDCVLVLFSELAGIICSCRPTHPNCSWVTKSLEGDTAQLDDMVSVNGILYATIISSPDKFGLVCLDSLIWKPLAMSMPFVKLPSFASEDYFVESLGRLYYVALGLGSSDDDSMYSGVKVFELDLHKKIWVEVNSLDGRAFFLSSIGSTSCWGHESTIGAGIQGNCLYILSSGATVGGPETLFLYNLLDETWTILSPCTSLVGAYEFPVWVLPQHQRSGLLSKESREEVVVSAVQGFCQLSQQQQHNETQESLLDKLPFHIIEKIPGFMHLFEYWNFRATSKIFRSSFPPRQQGTNNNVHPFLMSIKNGRLCTIMDPYRHDSRSNNILPFSVDPFTLEFSKNKWLLTRVAHSHSLEFINIFTGAIMRDFPPKDSLIFSSSIAFSTDPTYSDCLIVSIDSHCEYICFLKVGDVKWGCSFLDHEGIVFHPSSSTPIFLGGAFYYLDTSGYLGVFRLQEDGEPSWQVCDKPPTQSTDLFISSLVECGGDVYSVFIGKMGEFVQVFKFQDIKNDWVQVDYLGNHNFFVSRASSFSIVTNGDPKLRNRIYLPLLKGNGVVFYSLDTRKYHVMDHGYVMENLHGVKYPTWCCWV